MEADFRTAVLAHAPLAALVGERFTPTKRDQGGALSAIVYHRISGRRDTTQDGRSCLVESRMQFDFWSYSYDEVKAVVAAFIAATDGALGTTGGTNFKHIAIDSERDTWDAAEPGGGEQRVSLDLLIWHDEP